MVDMFIMPQAAVKHGIRLRAISKKVKGTDGEKCGSFGVLGHRHLRPRVLSLQCVGCHLSLTFFLPVSNSYA